MCISVATTLSFFLQQLWLIPSKEIRISILGDYDYDVNTVCLHFMVSNFTKAEEVSCCGRQQACLDDDDTFPSFLKTVSAPRKLCIYPQQLMFKTLTF